MMTDQSDPPSGFRITSARRGGPVASPVFRTAMALAAILCLMLMARICRTPPPATGEATTPTPTAAPAATRPPTPSQTPTPGFIKVGSDWVDAEIVLPPTPTLAIPTAAPVVRREPQPTPRISQCVSFRWSTLQVFNPSAHVKVDIRVDNRCPYDLGPNTLFFAITGWRDGARVQSVQGHPFETIRRGRSGDLSIGLPGSVDWYDEIKVVVFD